MSSTRHNASTNSSERKRLRDRRAQQTLRDKRESRLRALEERVAYCETNHCNELIQNHMIAVEPMIRENEALLARHEQLRRLIHGWYRQDTGPPASSLILPPTCMASEPLPTSTIASCSSGAEMVLADPQSQPVSDWTVPGFAHLGPSADGFTAPYINGTWPVGFGDQSANSLIVDIPLPSLSLAQTAPCPLFTNEEYALATANTRGWTRWVTSTGSIAKFPAVPSPLDLLHGSRRNWLADQINRLLRRFALREPDRLAYSWIAYVFLRWRINPTPLTFSHLPDFLQPVAGQLQQDQTIEMVFILWPQLRINLLENSDTIDPIELDNYAAGGCRVRWPSSKSIWEWDSDENIYIKPEFFQTFMTRSGWGLSSTFINKFPVLVKGIDVEAIRFDIP
ncbi:hypothetical protein ETB97_002437 [Aspergillus alliaceus]|uniref:BZIP domain-containing protein n=1 Tax=Petromyces alliaceus TaxID=209559 RepID=A0A8H6A430_PETAA|nr:hypothetical protein ETB97_002437 [Aspergillus burnettii]